MSVNVSGINHSALKMLIEANAIDKALVSANGDIWVLKIHFSESVKTVLAKNSGKARIWRKLDTLAKYLSNLGIEQFEIDMQDYDPTQKSLTRPDSAVILKKAHKAHKSLQEKSTNNVESIKKDKSVDNITHDDGLSAEKVRVNWEERRARILQQEDPRVK
jgi:kynurenine formamidase